MKRREEENRSERNYFHLLDGSGRDGDGDSNISKNMAKQIELLMLPSIWHTNPF